MITFKLEIESAWVQNVQNAASWNKIHIFSLVGTLYVPSAYLKLITATNL